MLFILASMIRLKASCVLSTGLESIGFMIKQETHVSCLFFEDVKEMLTDTNTRVTVKCVFCAGRRDVMKIVTKIHKL